MATLALVARVVGLRRILLLGSLVLALATPSMYVLASVDSLIHFYKDMPSPNGHTIISVYNGLALSPLTGIIGCDKIDELSNVRGVSAVWGEVTVPSLVGGSRLLVVRGIPFDPSIWSLAGLRVSIGKPPSESAENALVAYVGNGLAEDLNLNVGDIVVVDSVFTRMVVPLRVQGIIDAPPPYKWEILVPLETGWSLRGLRGCSTIRLVVDLSAVDWESITNTLGAENVQRQLPKVLVNQALILASKGYLLVGESADIGSYYVSYLGIPPEVIIVAGVAVDALLSLAILPAISLVSGGVVRQLRILYWEGASKAKLYFSILLVSMPIVFAATLSGSLIALNYLSYPKLLGYPLEPEDHGILEAVHLSIYIALYLVGLWRALGEVEG